MADCQATIGQLVTHLLQCQVRFLGDPPQQPLTIRALDSGAPATTHRLGRHRTGSRVPLGPADHARHADLEQLRSLPSAQAVDDRLDRSNPEIFRVGLAHRCWPPGQHLESHPALPRNPPRFIQPGLRSRGDFAFDFDAFGVGVGSGRGDVIWGGATDDNLFGRNLDDRLIGGAGDDILEGGDGRDLLEGGDGADRLIGAAGNDRLVGGADVDELMGGAGRDYLDAGAGHDMIEGGMGNDAIRGGTGADAFIVDPMSGDDLIFDFEALVGINGGNAQGAFDHLALRDIAPGNVTVSTGARSWEDQTYTGALVSWDVDHNGSADGSVLLAGVSPEDLRQSDFMFVDEPGFVAGVSTIGSYYIFA